MSFDGSRLAVEREADIKEVIVIHRLDAPASCIVRAEDPDEAWSGDDNFYIGGEVSVAMGYKDDTTEIFKGEITGVELSFRKNKTPIYSIKGHSLMHRLNSSKTTEAYADMTVGDIVDQIAANADLTADKENLPDEHLFTFRERKTDFEYLLEIAERYDCLMWEEDGTLIFKRPEVKQSEDLVLEYGKTLIEFCPERRTGLMISEVEVRGWDPAKIEKIRGSATLDDVDSTGGEIVDEFFGGAKEIVIDPQVIDINSADMLAVDHLARNAREFMQGYGTARGDVNIKAGAIIKLEALGEKFSQTYMVLDTKHVLIPDEGYLTHFDIISNTGNPGADAESKSNTGKSEPHKEPEPKEDDALLAGTSSDKKSEDEKEPEIINLKWMNEVDEEIDKAGPGETVKLTGEVKNLADGTWVRTALYTEGYKNEHNYLKVWSIPV
ncbi:MAG: phage late control D family protein, partial [bacterium]|nr:phage late control D family protein [bacterium]